MTEIESAGDAVAVRESAPDEGVVTRLLCAGVHLDDSFAEAVVRELLHEDLRYVAPSYGFDAVPVLADALVARARKRVKRGVIVLSPLTVLLFAVFGFEAAGIGVLIWLWITWVAIFLDKLLRLQILTMRVGIPGKRGDRARLNVPRHALLTERVIRRVTREQDSSNGLVFYGGFDPFVGAGVHTQSWNFPVLLRPRSATPLDGGANDEVVEFTGDELMRYVEDRLEGTLRADLSVERQIRGLDISRKWYRTAVGRHKPRWSERMSMPTRQGEEGYEAAREYLCIRISAWGQELVNSLFVNFDARGGTLFSEMHNYLLPPVKASYHQIDRLPDNVRASKVFWMAIASGVEMVSEALGAGMTVLFFPIYLYQQVKKRRREEEAVAGDDDARQPSPRRDAAIKDFGAQWSVREMATVPNYHHFFQSVDAVKYANISKRRVTEIILDFLEEKNVDTSEFRTQQAAILNYGILQAGDGKIVTRGAVAVGPNAVAS